MKTTKFVMIVVAVFLFSATIPFSVWSEPIEDEPIPDHPWGGEEAPDDPDPTYIVIDIGTPIVFYDVLGFTNFTTDEFSKFSSDTQIQPKQTAVSLEPTKVKRSTSTFVR